MRRSLASWLWVLGGGLVALLDARSPALARPTVKGTLRDGGGGAFVANGFRDSIRDADAECDGLCTFSIYYGNRACVRCMIGPGAEYCTPDYVDGCVEHILGPCGTANPHVTVTVPQAPGRAGRRQVDVDGVRYVLRCRSRKQCSPTATLPRAAGTELTGDWTLTETTSATDCPSNVAESATTRFASSQLRLIQADDALSACGPSANFPFSFGGAVSADGILLTSAGGVHGKEGGLTIGPMSSLDYARTISGGQAQADGSIPVSESWTFYPSTFELGPVVCTRTATAVLTPIRVPCASHADCLASGDACERCVQGVCTPDASCPSPYGTSAR